MYKSIVKLASTRNFYQFAGKLLPWLGWSTLILLLIGSYWGLVIAPTDYQQKDSYRIIYIHVPAAWMSLFIYMVMAGSGAAALIWKTKVSEIIANSCAQSAPRLPSWPWSPAPCGANPCGEPGGNGMRA